MDLIVDIKILATIKPSEECKYYFEIDEFHPQFYIDKFNLNLPEAAPFLQAIIRLLSKIFKDFANKSLYLAFNTLGWIINNNMFSKTPLNFLYDEFATDNRYIDFQFNECVNYQTTG